MKRGKHKKILNKRKSNFIAVGIALFLIVLISLLYSFTSTKNSFNELGRERPIPAANSNTFSPSSVSADFCDSKNEQYCNSDEDCRLECCSTSCSNNKCDEGHFIYLGGEDIVNNCLKKDGKICDGRGQCISCLDSDNGIDDIFMQSSTVFYKNPETPEQGSDFCESEDILIEYICDGGVISSKKVECNDYASKCQNGACVKK